MTICPQDCMYRTPTCHCACKIYQEGAAKLKEAQAKLKKGSEADRVLGHGRYIRFAVNRYSKRNND